MTYTRLFLPTILLFVAQILQAQVSCDPVFPNPSDDVVIFYDATQGNGALNNVNPVYVHMGVITNLSTSPTDWKYVKTDWGTADPDAVLEYVSPNIWKKSINIQQFFGVPAGETILRLAFVFRNLSGSVVGRAADGSDIFYDIYPENAPLQSRFLKPDAPSLLTSIGAAIPVQAAASMPGNLALFDNGVQLTTATGENLSYTLNVNAGGFHQVDFVVNTGTEQDTATFFYLIPEPVVVENPPAGSTWGISYLDDQSARLVLYAPKKALVHAVGDFSDWLPKPAFQMKRSQDSTLWWIDLTGLPANQPVRFQYWINGGLRIADPLSTLVLDAGNDPFIPAETFPDLPPYPYGKTSGAVSVLQTAQTPYNWQTGNYQRPKKTDLLIYELILRDFIAAHDYQTLLDTLDYLQTLGINAIELMPINEFDGNISWGYNPTFHKALDKYYGTAEALKQLVDACHQRNMAVIIDVVFNQAHERSPLAQMYWDAANNQPAADNPWLNPIAKHDFNVFNDFNHESQATKTYMKNCLEYWISEFRFDGFRFDLSKGFTQKNTLGNTGAWGQYDLSRIAIWKDYANFIWAIDPEFYVILEHFADNIEEKELAEYGMMLWGNVHGAYKDVGLGTNAGLNASLSGVSYKQRNWTVPHLISYMESHDEERIMVDLKNNGAVNGGYNVKNYFTALRRIELLNNLLYTVPGPKMMWQFGNDLGYDFPINYCEDGTINNGCRTSPKPIRWDYYVEPARKRLYDVTAALLNLRNNHDVFETSDFVLNLSSGSYRAIRLNSPTMNVSIAANAGTSTLMPAVNFQHTGTWYEYYTGATLDVTGATASITLAPGEYRLYTDVQVPLPPGLNPTPATEANGAINQLIVYPNPVDDLALVQFSLRADAHVRAEVFDLSGRSLGLYADAIMDAGEQYFEINTAGWPQGVYVLTLRDQEGGMLVQKIVK